MVVDPNLYRYVRNNPVIHVDPSGLEYIVADPGQSLLGTITDFLGGGESNTYFFGNDTTVSRRMRGLPDLGWVFKHFYCDLDKYCCNPIYGDQKSWVQTHYVTAGVGGYIGDIVTLFGLPWNGFVEVSPQTIGSFTYKVDMSIDCANKTKSLTVTVYNTWSVASLTRNPVTGQALANSGLNPVDIIVEMKNEDVSVPTGWFTRLMRGCLW